MKLPNNIYHFEFGTRTITYLFFSSPLVRRAYLKALDNFTKFGVHLNLASEDGVSETIEKPEEY